MKVINNSDSLLIILHEIYGINGHMEMMCRKFAGDGYDIICPNLIHTHEPFSYDQQEEAYNHFMTNIGFDSAVKEVKQLIKQAKKQYSQVYLLGYSIGATIAWICSNEENICDGIIAYYGSRIRDYINFISKCPALLIFPSEEKSFDVKELADYLKERSIDVHILTGKHGFGDAFSKNYREQSFRKAEKLVDKFLGELK